MIPWRPIAELPDALKDGREVLVWCKDGIFAGTSVVRWFEQSFEEDGGWWESDGGTMGLNSPTAFCEINPPEGT